MNWRYQHEQIKKKYDWGSGLGGYQALLLRSWDWIALVWTVFGHLFKFPANICPGSPACLLSHLWLCDHMNCILPGSSVHGIFPARILEWAAMPSSRGSSWPRDRICVSGISCTASEFFTAEPLGKSHASPITPLKMEKLTLLFYFFWSEGTQEGFGGL